MTRLWLFLSSIAPGVIVVGIRALGESWIAGSITILVGFLLIPAGFRAIRIRKDVEPIPLSISGVKDESIQVPTYLISLVFPFLFVTINDPWSLTAYAVFIVFVGLILAQSETSLINPILLLRGFRIYDATTVSEGSVTIISKKKPRPGSHENGYVLSNHTYIVRNS
ncbi:hypothetical protein [Nesterenkonia lutea]|uniref:DUF1616 domain-containing protein n=1 Tax=Nesterenkonia lutea TaxID=272919 RepID=A0ABR9JED8_9MICC|nr:hypothetical protein [Nesterenkonia lutea]MBE1524289.1 hypothetical protein [Nesterenkonia lutea]